MVNEWMGLPDLQVVDHRLHCSPGPAWVEDDPRRVPASRQIPAIIAGGFPRYKVPTFGGSTRSIRHANGVFYLNGEIGRCTRTSQSAAERANDSARCVSK